MPFKKNMKRRTLLSVAELIVNGNQGCPIPVADPGFLTVAPTPERSVQVYYFTVF